MIPRLEDCANRSLVVAHAKHMLCSRDRPPRVLWTVCSLVEECGRLGASALREKKDGTGTTAILVVSEAGNKLYSSVKGESCSRTLVNGHP